MRLDEQAIIDAIAAAFRDLGALADALADDTALLPAQAAGVERVITADVVVEGRDFARALYVLEHAGGRALVQNLSDIAAAGAVPVGFVWSLGIPPTTSLDDVRAFSRGAARVAAAARCPLLGGDLSRTDGPLFAAITILGDVRGARLTRGGAQPGDDVFVSRPTGGSAAGLRALQAGVTLEGAGDIDARAIRAHVEPDAELALGQALVGVATACIDVSDGLLLDLSRLARTSRVGLDLDGLAAAVDVSAGATEADAYGGGEDWALAFSAPAGAPVPARCIRIGRVRAGQGLWRGGAPLMPQGYDHFAT